MKVNLVCHGRFLAFEIARELKRRASLGALYTSTPLFGGRVRLEDYQLDRRDVFSYPWPMVFQILATRCCFDKKAALHARRWANRWFCQWVRGKIHVCDVVHVWAGHALEVFRLADEWGSLKVLDRASAHRKWNRELLTREYKSLGEDYIELDCSVERELEEYEQADVIVVPSGFAKSTFEQEGFPSEKVVVIPFGAPCERVGPARRPGGCFRVIYVGAQTIRKGTRYFYQAAAALASHGEMEFVIVGPGPEKALRREFEEYRWAVRYLGYKTKRELHEEVYPTASVLVQPSLSEGLSYVVLEALSHGVPVIATPSTGCGEVLRDGQEGFIIPPRDPDAIVERIQFLHGNRDELERMSRNAWKATESTWTWEHYGERLVETYRAFLRKARPGVTKRDVATRGDER